MHGVIAPWDHDKTMPSQFVQCLIGPFSPLFFLSLQWLIFVGVAPELRLKCCEKGRSHAPCGANLLAGSLGAKPFVVRVRQRPTRVQTRLPRRRWEIEFYHYSALTAHWQLHLVDIGPNRSLRHQWRNNSNHEWFERDRRNHPSAMGQ